MTRQCCCMYLCAHHPSLCTILIHCAPLLPPARPQLPPAAAVKALMEAMDLASPSVTLLKRRLDSLARLAGDRGARKNAIKHLYISAQVGVHTCITDI